MKNEKEKRIERTAKPIQTREMTLNEKRGAFEALNPEFIDFELMKFNGRDRMEGAGAIINPDFNDRRRGNPSHVFAATKYSRQVVWLELKMLDVIQPDGLNKYGFYPLVAELTNEYTRDNPEPETNDDPDYTQGLLTYIYHGVLDRWFPPKETDENGNELISRRSKFILSHFHSFEDDAYEWIWSESSRELAWNVLNGCIRPVILDNLNYDPFDESISGKNTVRILREHLAEHPKDSVAHRFYEYVSIFLDSLRRRNFVFSTLKALLDEWNERADDYDRTFYFYCCKTLAEVENTYRETTVEEDFEIPTQENGKTDYAELAEWLSDV